MLPSIQDTSFSSMYLKIILGIQHVSAFGSPSRIFLTNCRLCTINVRSLMRLLSDCFTQCCKAISAQTQ